ncbi:MAG: hypothetical protein Q9204_004434, partial [Flavoplaca sp. TL-2023a]
MTTHTETRTTVPPTLTPHHHSPEHHQSPEPKIPRGPVTATLNFYHPPADASKPFNYVESSPPGQPQRNYSDIA